MKWKVIVIVIVAMLVVAALGGVAFYFIESNNEAQLRPVVHEQLAAFISKYPCINTSLLYTLSNMVSLFQQGGLQIGPANDPLFNISNWDIRAGIFLSFQVIGAIGYGNAPPRTTGGRAFCVVLAIIGIPLFVVTSFGVGDVINTGWQRAVKRVRVHPLSKKHQVYSQVIRLLSMITFGIIFFCIIPAAIFSAVEGWYYGDSLYYTLVTMLTIGFGDFVPGSTMDNDFRNWYRLAIGFWILLMLLWFAATWTSVRFVLAEHLNEPDEKTAEKDEDPRKVNMVHVEMSPADVSAGPQTPASQSAAVTAPIPAGLNDNWKYPFNVGK